MSNLKYRHKIKRIATVQNPRTKERVVIGEVEEWKRTEDFIEANIRLFDDVPEVMRETIEKNPGCIQVIEQLAPPQDILIIPSRPKIIES